MQHPVQTEAWFVSKLVRKAAKLGCLIRTYRVGGSLQIEVPAVASRFEVTGGTNLRVREFCLASGAEVAFDSGFPAGELTNMLVRFSFAIELAAAWQREFVRGFGHCEAFFKIKIGLPEAERDP
jgi:hypothetical protein